MLESNTISKNHVTSARNLHNLVRLCKICAFPCATGDICSPLKCATEPFRRQTRFKDDPRDQN